MRFLFWILLFLILYHFLIYPFSLLILANLKVKRIKRRDFFPSVTLIIPVYNEEKVIREKIVNSLSLDYPKEKLEIIFASDGSKDDSNNIIREYLNKGIRFIEFSEHSGKSVLLNNTIPQANGEIIFLSDATGMINKGAIKEMVKNFYDPEVGCVCGIYHIWGRDKTISDEFEERYLDFEFFLKKLESKIYTTLGGHGALYAIRKDLFIPLDEDIINDDFFISSNIALKGFRTVYEEKAHIFDRIHTDIRTEFRRRLRLIFGGWQQIIRLRRLFSLKRPFFAWQFFSHKFLRLILPFCFLFIILSSIFLYRSFFILIIFLLFFSLVFFKRFSLIFFLGNLAGIIGTYKFFFRRNRRIW